MFILLHFLTACCLHVIKAFDYISVNDQHYFHSYGEGSFTRGNVYQTSEHLSPLVVAGVRTKRYVNYTLLTAAKV